MIEYYFENALKIVEDLSDIFDVARIVDPVECKIINLTNENGKVDFDEYMCYQVWNKGERCKNCISIQAHYLNKRMTKFEFVNDDVYHVIAKPIKLNLPGGRDFEFVLEMVNKVTDEILFEAFGKSEFIDKITAYEKKIYEDSLTKVFNRRYLDEKVFCYNINLESGEEVVFIMADLKNFKGINDTYGHAVGDWVLIRFAQAMNSCVRSCDSVIRIGGDEFLIVLRKCNINIAERIIDQIKERMKDEIVYDKDGGKYAVANFGMAYTPDFYCDDDRTAQMLAEADRNMYINKNSQAGY